jgi:alkylation response protein AidB-like acyl-CoA dehydrogenase
MTDQTLLPSRDLLELMIFDWLGQGEPDEREIGMAMLDAALRIAADEFMPHYKAGDRDEPRIEDRQVRIHPAFHDALDRYREAGLFGASFPEELGGLGLSNTMWLAITGIFAAANAPCSAYPMLTAANARLLATFGSGEQISQFARPQIEGRWFGTMCLSEPQAGSSLGDIKTRAIPEGEDGLGHRYRITGNKMWISGGDQDASENIVHLVLAKVAGADGALPDGTKGISLFIVPKVLPEGQRNDIAVAGLNHKLGYRGTSNCLLNFGEESGAIGWLVGSEGHGLAQMFQMMNEARIGVGISAACMAYRSYRHAVRYAGERLQGRSPGVKVGPPVPIIDHADVRRMLVQQKLYSEGALALCLYCARLVDEGGEDAETLLALLTPIAKSWSSEFGVIASDLAIQVHGGYGYTRDFDVEQLWRDNRLNPIHEGTSGIQALDLLGRKLLLSDGKSLGLLRARVEATLGKAATDQSLIGAATKLGQFWQRVDGVLGDLAPRPAELALAEATLFLRAFGHGVVGWLWLDLACCAASGSAVLEASTRAGCLAFADGELPQALAWLDIVSQEPASARLPPEQLFA